MPCRFECRGLMKTLVSCSFCLSSGLWLCRKTEWTCGNLCCSSVLQCFFCETEEERKIGYQTPPIASDNLCGYQEQRDSILVGFRISFHTDEREGWSGTFGKHKECEMERQEKRREEHVEIRVTDILFSTIQPQKWNRSLVVQTPRYKRYLLFAGAHSFNWNGRKGTRKVQSAGTSFLKKNSPLIFQVFASIDQEKFECLPC